MKINIFLFRRNFAFSPEAQAVILDGNLQILGLDPGKLRPDIDVVMVFRYIYQGIYSPPGKWFRTIAGLEKTLQAALELGQFPERLIIWFSKDDRHSHLLHH